MIIWLTMNWFIRIIADRFSVNWQMDWCINSFRTKIVFSSDGFTYLLSFSIQSIMSYNGGAVMAMRGKNCVAIASDRRFGIQAQMVTTDFQKIFPMGERLYIGLAGLATDVQTVWVCLTSMSFSVLSPPGQDDRLSLKLYKMTTFRSFASVQTNTNLEKA